MATTVQVDNLASTITEWLTEYNEEVTDVAKEAVDEVAQGVFDEIKNHVTWQDKKYSNSFALKTSFEDERNKRKTWYVKSPHYRLTHLLEFGHATRNGGRTKAYPHVKYGDQYLYNNFERVMREKIEKCKI